MQSLAAHASAQMNGRAKKGKKAKKGQPNGFTDPAINGHISRTQRQRSAKSQGRFAVGLFSTTVRILLWYSIITALFRCPTSPSELTDDSPRLCKPYLSLRSQAAPYIEPHYNKYLAPHIETARPYVDRIHQQVYSPAARFATENYDKYGAPRVAQLQAAAATQWESTLRPQLESAQAVIQEQYDANLAPHVQKAFEVARPYYNQASSAAVDAYHSHAVPAYNALLPYGKQAWAYGHHVTVNLIFPNVRWAEASARQFFLRTVWPKLRVLYGDSVEPQLMRISERLGRYKDGKKLESVIESIIESAETSSATVPPPSDAPASAEPVAESGEVPSSSTQAANSEKPLRPEEIAQSIQSDLRKWQNKFAKAADKGSEDLEERVKEITDKQIKNQAHGIAPALIVELEEAAATAVKTVKTTIIDEVKALPSDPSEAVLEAAHERVIKTIADTTRVVKQKAQAVRDWKQNYDRETHNLVKAASDSTLDVIDNIRDLGLQEIGMRWAWMDGVTYKDWQNYHELKRTFDEWRDEVQARAMQHEGLAKAAEEGESVQEKAMEVAMRVVKEVIRLKDVAKWKLWAQDATDDFNTREVPPRVAKAAKDVVQEAAEKLSEASASVVGTSQDYIESVTSAASKKLEEAVSSISSAIAGKDTETAASEAVADSIEAPAESVVSADKFKTEEEGEAPKGSPAPPLDPVVSEASSSIEAASSAASKRVWGGAAAAFVEAKQQPLLDDDFVGEYSEKVQSMVSAAGDKAADITRAIGEAWFTPTSTNGAVESVTSLAQEQYEKAFSAASNALYGSRQGTLESISSLASERYAHAVTAASYAIYGTPTNFAESIATTASSRLDAALSAASDQYSIAMSHLSEQMGATPKPVHEKMLSSIESAYSGALTLASQKYQMALQLTESMKTAVAGPTPGVLESISAIANSKLSDGMSMASEQYSKAKAAAGAEPTPAHQQYLADAQRQYYQAIGLAHARYAEFMEAASSAVFGAPTPAYQSVIDKVASVASEASSSVIGSQTPWHESIASQASQNWEALVSKASVQIYGQPTPLPDSLLNRAGAYGAQATEAAAAQYSALHSLVSELVVGKEPDFTESVMLRLASAYYTGAPALASSASSLFADSFATATSVLGEIFTPPAILETIFEQANDQINAALSAASVQIYGTPKGRYEQASESAASAYSAASSAASAYIYGTPTGYVEAAQSSIAAIASSASVAMSQAIFGTPTPTGHLERASSAAAEAYTKASSAAAQNYEQARARVSEAIYGKQQGALESATSRVAKAVESAQSRLSAMVVGAGDAVEDVMSSINNVVNEAASSVSSAMNRARDEL